MEAPYRSAFKEYILATFFGTIFTSLAFGQTTTAKTDPFLISTIEKQIRFPDSINYPGITLIRISKDRESICLETLYFSAAPFSLESDKYLIGRLNKLKDHFALGYSALIALHFDYNPGSDNQMQVGEEEMKTLKKKICELKRFSHLLRSISILGYPTVF